MTIRLPSKMAQAIDAREEQEQGVVAFRRYSRLDRSGPQEVRNMTPSKPGGQ
jgi:hypothetical protein